jgi:hypothetical protein
MLVAEAVVARIQQEHSAQVVRVVAVLVVQVWGNKVLQAQ